MGKAVKKKKSEKPGKKKEEKKEEKKAPVKKAKSKPKTNAAGKELRGIIRLAGKDVGGEVNLKRALLRVRGIGHTLALAASMIIHRELGINPEAPVGELTDDKIEKIDQILFNLQDHKLPTFMLNRNKDFTGGKDRHVIMNDLIFEVNQDVDREKKMYSWRGYRHAYGQKTRGQKTRNTGRSGMAVGVLRKSVIAAQGGGAGKAGPARAGSAKAEKKK
jgi:small subunit ribosomal protein S13